MTDVTGGAKLGDWLGVHVGTFVGKIVGKKDSVASFKRVFCEASFVSFAFVLIS